MVSPCLMYSRQGTAILYGSDAIARLLQPSFRDRANAADHGGELRTLEHRSRNLQADNAMLSLYSDDLKVRQLEAVLLGSAKFPLARVPMANVLRIVRFL